MNNKKVELAFIFFYFFILYGSLLIGLYFNEDNLGGAQNDSLHHFRISEKFNNEFFETFNNFGNSEQTRNSPVFWIFLSILNKFFSYNSIQMINTLVIFPITFFFYKSLKIKFNQINSIYLIILSSFLFLSPSLRSLIIWPYSLSWGLLFFIISIYFFLKYETNLNFQNSLKILSFVIISSYIYPSFSVFYFFYIFKIYQQNPIKIITFILFLSFLMALPCIYYIITKDALSAFQASQGMKISLEKSLNLSNKILIISTICLYCLLPIISFKDNIRNVFYIKNQEKFLISVFIFINFYFFSFPHSVWGGGFFHKASNILFSNNSLFFISSFFSIFFLYYISKGKINNYFLLLLLILYNPQFTIYIKYFDPLIYIVFLTLFDFDLNKNFFQKKYKFFQFFSVIIFYYIVVYLKKIIF